MSELSASLLTQLYSLICPAVPGATLELVTGIALITLKLPRMQWSEVQWCRICTTESGIQYRRVSEGSCVLCELEALFLVTESCPGHLHTYCA